MGAQQEGAVGHKGTFVEALRLLSGGGRCEGSPRAERSPRPSPQPRSPAAAQGPVRRPAAGLEGRLDGAPRWQPKCPGLESGGGDRRPTPPCPRGGQPGDGAWAGAAGSPGDPWAPARGALAARGGQGASGDSGVPSSIFPSATGLQVPVPVSCSPWHRTLMPSAGGALARSPLAPCAPARFAGAGTARGFELGTCPGGQKFGLISCE